MARNGPSSATSSESAPSPCDGLYPMHNTSRQYGENGHVEYKWSTYIQEKIVQLSFHLTRTYDPAQIVRIGGLYCDLLQEILLGNHVDKELKREYISVVYRMMLHTRDIIDGKGEYQLFYVLLSEWVKIGALSSVDERLPSTTNRKQCREKREFVETLANDALESTVALEGHKHAYGSWKDIKYFLEYLFSRDDIPGVKHDLPIFKKAMSLVVTQLEKDSYCLDETSTSRPSLLAKWLPREKSRKFGWLAKFIAGEYYVAWLTNSTSTVTTSKGDRIAFPPKSAERKCLTHYRKLVASLNRKLGTIQINQCGRTWSEIDFEKSATSLTMLRQKNAFQYITKGGRPRGCETDRVACKINYHDYIRRCETGKARVKGDRLGVVDLVKDALYYNSLTYSSTHHDSIEITKKSINLQWKQSGEKIQELENLVAMVDTSGSMAGDALYAALGLGCRIAEKSLLGRRVLTFDAKPKWIDLRASSTLTEMISTITSNNEWGLNTNFASALQVILDACVEQELTPEQVSDLTLVILSDMQIDRADPGVDSMHDLIEKMFYDGGLKTKHATPYKCPHIMYWNLRSLTGFPALSFMENTSMLSGFNPNLLHSFCNKGRGVLSDCDPWTILNNQLSNNRYTWIDKKLDAFGIFAGDEDEQDSTTSDVELLVDEPPEDVLDITDTVTLTNNPWWTWTSKEN